MLTRLVTKGESKEKALAHLISDIDNNEANTPFVGIPGGVMGLLMTIYQ